MDSYKNPSCSQIRSNLAGRVGLGRVEEGWVKQIRESLETSWPGPTRPDPARPVRFLNLLTRPAGQVMTHDERRNLMTPTTYGMQETLTLS